MALLAVIAILLALVLALLPGGPPADSIAVGATGSPEEGASDQADDEPMGSERDAGDTSGRTTEPDDFSGGATDGAGSGAADPDVSEEYPEEERLPDEDRPRAEDTMERDLWWLPTTDVPPAQRGPLVLVIDDAGNTLDAYDRFLAFPGPATIAVLPRLDYSVQAAAMASATGKEIILHQPMEAVGGADPGPGAIGISLDAEEITVRVRENLASVPGAIGVNNHMGSLATSQLEVMRPLLTTLHERGLFFLDSRTSAETVGRRVAYDVGIPFAERNVFLDNERTREAILAAIEHALELSLSGQPVIMIGHATVPLLADILNEVHPVLLSDGYEFVPLSTLTGRVRLASENPTAEAGQ